MHSLLYFYPMRVNMVILMVCASLTVFSQKYNPNDHYHAEMAVSASYYYGTIFKHSSNFLPEVSEKSHAVELSFSKITKGAKPWQRKLNYPEIGGAMVFARFGNNEIFGNAYALIPYAKFWLLRRSKVDLYSRIGFGLGYITKPYNRVNNPTNNVIGSKLNNCTQFSFGLDYKVHRRLSFFTALNFTHFSNASFQSPNLGINYLAFSTGLRYLPKPTKNGFDETPIPKPIQKNFFRLNGAMAFYENRAAGGPKYPIYVVSAAYSRSTSVVNRFFTGVNYAFDVGKKEYISQFVVEEKAIKASDLSIFIGDEIYLGRLSFDALLGIYILNAYDSTPPVYAKLGLNYHAVKFGETKEKSLFIGVHMKTHYSVAQYFDVGLGLNL